MQIHAVSKGKVAAVLRRRRFGFSFGTSPKMRRLVDPVPLTRLLSSKSIGLDRLSRSAIVPMSAGHSGQGFSFYRANIHKCTPTHVVTKCSQYRRRRTTMSARIDIRQRRKDDVFGRVRLFVFTKTQKLWSDLQEVFRVYSRWNAENNRASPARWRWPQEIATVYMS